MLEGPPLAKALRPKLTEVFMQLTKRSYGVVGGLAALSLALGLGVATKVRAGSRDSMTLPQHTPIQVVLDQPVSADRTKAGDRFAATVAQPVVVDGNTVIPKGARVSGVVVESRHGGRIKGEADLRLALHSVKVNGTSYPIHTTAFHRSSKSHKRRNLLMIGGGAGTGVLIGALAGGGAGALIGGPVGAGAGTAAAILTNKKDVKLPAETHLTFKLSEPVSIPAKS
ncbi:MAG: hypothetical protein DMG58_04885 [Acidobacteria bacterium]|nr:MAG: hypothetical protein DMG58_04885 [Acidobacteriota bacterium]